MSVAMRWARKRNWNKRILLGASAALNRLLHEYPSTLVPYERLHLKAAFDNIVKVEEEWEGHQKWSKENYISVERRSDARETKET